MNDNIDDVLPIDRSIWEIVDLYRKAPKSLKQATTSKIVKEINKLDVKCMCNMITRFDNFIVCEEITFAFISKCKKVCNFCQVKHKNKLQTKYINKLQIHNYLKVFEYETLRGNTQILNFLINSNNLSLPQLYETLSTNDKITCNDTVVEKIIKLFIESSHDTTKLPYEILATILKKEEYVAKFSQLFSTLIIDLVKNNKLEIFDSKSVFLFTNNDIVLNHAIKHCEIAQLESIVDKCSAISISYNNFYTLYQKFDQRFIMKLVSKMTNIFSYISYCSSKMNNTTINVVVESANIIGSLPRLNDENVYNDLCLQVKIFINYVGEVGYDASGLKKDFFTNCSLELKSMLVECDGYLTIPKNFDLNEMEIKFISLMLARSIFVENISPQIKFHPVLSYLMIVGGYSINFEHFHNFLSHFEIEFIDNTFKLLNLSTSDYEMFIDLQSNDKMRSLTREQYIINQITKKYVHPKLIEFVNGFRVFFKSLYLIDYVNPVVFHKYICGTSVYSIDADTPHSLKCNLNVIGVIGKQRTMFINVFTNVLSELNLTSVVKLQLFFKYWFATSSIISFSDRTPNVYVRLCSTYTGRDKYHCFYSATCFDKLTITIAHKEFMNENLLSSFIKASIDSSIENQKIWESTGIHMQLA